MQRHEFTQFAGALTDARGGMPEGIVAPPGAVLAERFAVYRNNVFAGLVDVLADRFPVTLAVVGDDFFRAMARAYVQRSRPENAVLYEYGDAFPDFVLEFPSAATLPWLADLARLEALWSQSWGAADTAVLCLADLGGIAPDALLAAQVVAHPAARLLRSVAPVASLWYAHQDGNPDLSTIPWQAQDVLITRPMATVQLVQLTPGVAPFALALMQGKSLEAAAGDALGEASDFDIGPALAGLVNSGFATELKLPCN